MLLEVSTGEVVKARPVKRRPKSEQFPPGDQVSLRKTAKKRDGYSEKRIHSPGAVPTVPTNDDAVFPVSVPEIG